MFWLLSRALCCLLRYNGHSDSSRGGGYGYPPHYRDDSDEDSDDEGDGEIRARVVELSALKRDAIDATVDVIVAENLLRRHGYDSTLLMYHDECAKEMRRALDRLPVTSRRARLKRSREPSRHGVRYARGVV